MARSDFPIDLVDMPNKPGRPTLPTDPNKPGQPPTEPDRPRPTNPITDPGKPGQPTPSPPPDPPANPLPPNEPAPPEKPGNPTPPLEPTGAPGTGGDFSKGQPYQDVLGASKGQPPESFYGSDRGFDPYFGATAGINRGSGATSYDPLGIGPDAYTDPNADVWSMTGVNSVLQPGSKIAPRYGVVGGQGGYGYGMVGQDYTGPLANDARPLVKELRKQRRQLNRATAARKGGPGVVDGPGGFGGNAANNGGGSGTVNGPGGFGSAGGNMDWKGQPSGGTEGAAGGAGGAGSKWGAPPAAASGAQPEPAVVGGNGTGTTGGLGTPSTDALGNALGWNPLTTPTSMGNMFETQWGRLVPSSTGNQNVFQLENDPTKLFHYDPNAVGKDGVGARGGWKSMTPESYAGYGDYQYKDPRQFGAAASPMQQQWTKKNGLIQGLQGTGAYA